MLPQSSAFLIEIRHLLPFLLPFVDPKSHVDITPIDLPVAA
jgi:hypothetical protein